MPVQTLEIEETLAHMTMAALRHPHHTEQLAQLLAQQADLAEAVTLARDFAELVRTRQPERLDGWLARATTSAVSALQRFAQGLRDDYAASKLR
jgi:transposase